MKTKYLNIFAGALMAMAGLAVTSCSDELDPELTGGEYKKGYLNLEFILSNEAATRGTASPDGQNRYNENKFNTVDFFFYAEDAGDEDKALLHLSKTTDADGSVDPIIMNIPISELKPLNAGPSGKTFRLLAVANCSATHKETISVVNPSLKELKEITTEVSGTRVFRAGAAPADFVMTNLDQLTLEDDKLPKVTFNDDEGGGGSLVFKRLASKIRVALDIDWENGLTDGGVKWVPNEVRLFFTNGVNKARLDGDAASLGLQDGDYYDIATTGSKYEEDGETETENYLYARPMTKHDSNGLIPGTSDTKYTTYNELPLYTYPNKWEDTMFEKRQSTLTIVVQWKSVNPADPSEETFRLSYYAMPVNKEGEILSNAYYYLRAHIGMMGSDSPMTPLEVEMECEIADWGKANETVADIRPVRYLQFNQNSFVVNNENSVTIPFYSSHNITDVSLTCNYNLYNYYGGKPQERWFDQNVTVTNGSRDNLYKITIDNKNKTLTFTHNLFDTWSTYPALNTRNSSKTKTTSFTKGGSSESTTSRKLYTEYTVDIVVRHSDQGAGTEFEETIRLVLRPAIYLYTEDVDKLSNGGIRLNGYGRVTGDTGSLGGFSGSGGGNGSADCIYYIVVTQLNEDDAKNWTLDDPRTNFINNLMDDNSMLTDNADVTTVWTENGGPYPATNSNRTQAGDGVWRTIWEDYDGPAWSVNWGTNQVWKPQNDTPAARGTNYGLKYYYPTAEGSDKADIIGPKLIFVSHHATNNGVTTLARARRRCATYQQAGYPAGRWRLPTEAEMAFMKKMKLKDVTTDIFGNVNYWTSQGKMDGNDASYKAGSKDGTAYARCVYDAWYWERVDAEGNRVDDRIRNQSDWMTFTYGDRPRESYLNKVNKRGAKQKGSSVEDFLKYNSGIRPIKNKR